MYTLRDSLFLISCYFSLSVVKHAQGKCVKNVCEQLKRPEICLN